MSVSAARSEFRLGGKPLAAALLGVTCGASPIPFNVLPLVMGPMHQEFGWDFAALSAGMTIFGIIASLLSPVYGAMADRLGVRPVALCSLFAFGVVFGAFWFMPGSLTGYYVLWAILGVVGIGSTPVTWSRAISMWFSRNRGLALGIMLLGTSVAGMVVPQIAQAAIAEGGWRLAFPVLALLPLLVALPVALLWFREPQPEERPTGISDASGRVVGLTLRETVRGYRFWVLFASISLAAFAYAGAHIHMAQIVQLHGFDAVTAARVMGVVALGILAGRLIVGLLFDRFWAPGVAFPALLLPALACYLLMGDSTALSLLMVGGFLLGFAAGTESDVIAFLTARYFGMAHYGRIYGVLYMPFGIFSAISPVVYGAVRDATGSYDLVLMASMVLFVAGGALLLLLGEYPDLTRRGSAEHASTAAAVSA
jgi:MFS family permease